LFMILHDID